MFEIGQVVWSTKGYPTIHISRHEIDGKEKIVDADGKEQFVYHMSDYAVWFTEEQMINEFSVTAKTEK